MLQVEAANLFSLTLGFSPGEPPALEKKTVGKMGLKGVAGLRLAKTPHSSSFGQGQGQGQGQSYRR